MFETIVSNMEIAGSGLSFRLGLQYKMVKLGSTSAA